MNIQKELLTVKDLVELFGEVESTIRKRLSRRQLPFVKLGSSVRVKREDVLQFIEARTVRKEARPA